MTFIRTALFLLITIYSLQILAQKNDSTTVYRVNRWTTGAIGIGGLIVSQEMLKQLSNAEAIPYSTIISLDKSQVNKFDRRALEQSNYEFCQ